MQSLTAKRIIRSANKFFPSVYVYASEVETYGYSVENALVCCSHITCIIAVGYIIVTRVFFFGKLGNIGIVTKSPHIFFNFNEPICNVLILNERSSTCPCICTIAKLFDASARQSKFL